MQFPSRRARVALLAGLGTLAVAAPANAAVTETFDAATGKLTIAYDQADGDIELAGTPGGKVTIGGAPGTTDASAVKSIEVLESGDAQTANTIDLSGVSAAAYTQLESTHLKAANGNDTVVGSFAADRIEGGRQNDTMRGLDGDDTLVWNNGEGTDDMFGGDGIDTIENNGADTGSATQDEVYTVETIDGGFKFSRLPNPALPAPGGAFALNVKGAENYVNNMLGGVDKFSTLDPTKPVKGINVTLNGGDGNDELTGTDGNDTLNGGTGNDKLVGFKGNDNHNGDAGDDLMVWNPGDGSDKMDGGDGNDVAQDNGGGGVDHFVVTAQGQRVTATRDNVAPFFLDIGTTETLDLNGNGGDDSVDVNGGLAALIKVDADLGDGNDTIDARNGSVEKIDGGAGTDTARVDADDQVSNVETVDAPVAEDKDAPKVTILSKKLKVKSGKAAVKVSCPAGESSCDGKIKIVRNGKVVGSIATKLVGGQTKTYQVQLNRKTRVALSKAPGKKLRVTLKISATDAAGNTGKVSKQLNLKG
jgi:Ca2+-binding RTX toxin-like protein